MDLTIVIPTMLRFDYYVARDYCYLLYLCKNNDHELMNTFLFPKREEKFFFKNKDYDVYTISTPINNFFSEDSHSHNSYHKLRFPPISIVNDAPMLSVNELLTELRTIIRKCKSNGVSFEDMGRIFDLEHIDNIMIT